MDSKQRDYAIQTIGRLRRAPGTRLFDFANIIAMPNRDLQTYLTDNVCRPLESRLGAAFREGFGAISYAFYSAFDRDKELIHFSFAEGVRISPGVMPEGIEIGINLTREKHIVKPKPVELMLYVKALQDEPFLMPDDFLSRKLTLV